MMKNLMKQKVNLPVLIDDAEKAAKELKLQTRLLRKYVQRIGK
jgi:hypothetical protein